MELYDGYYYSTSLDVPGAHKTPDGRAVGIFCRASAGYVPNPDTGAMERSQLQPDRVVFIMPKTGHNLMKLSDDGQSLVRVEYAPKDLPDLKMIEVVDHLPEERWDKEVYPPGKKFSELLAGSPV